MITLMYIFWAFVITGSMICVFAIAFTFSLMDKTEKRRKEHMVNIKNAIIE